MKLKLNQLIGMRGSLVKLLEKDMPIKQSYNLARFIKQANTELEQFEQSRIKLVNKYGEKDEQGNVTVAEFNQPQFMNELNELTDLEIDFPHFRALKLSDLRNITFSTNDMMGLVDIIEE
jgi:hypothetical protein